MVLEIKPNKINMNNVGLDRLNMSIILSMCPQGKLICSATHSPRCF